MFSKLFSLYVNILSYSLEQKEHLWSTVVCTKVFFTTHVTFMLEITLLGISNTRWLASDRFYFCWFWLIFNCCIVFKSVGVDLLLWIGYPFFECVLTNSSVTSGFVILFATRSVSIYKSFQGGNFRLFIIFLLCVVIFI